MSDSQTRERTTSLLFYVCVLVLGYLLYLVCAPFLRPLTWAAILAAFFYPQFRRIAAVLGKNRAAVASTILVALIFIVPFGLIVTLFVQQANETIHGIDMTSSSSEVARVQSAWAWLQNKGLGASLGNFDEAKQKAISWLTGIAARAAGSVVRNLIEIVVNLFISLFAMFFLFRDGDVIMNQVRMVLPFDSSFSDRQINNTVELIRASISATFAVALTQGTIGGIAFAVLGIGAPIFWGVMMSFFALLPLGTGIVWLPVAIWLLLTGHTGRGIALIAIGFGVIGLVDNFMRPILLTGRTQMNGLLVFISLLGGIAAFGLLGLFLGPVIVAFATSYVSAYASERQKFSGNIHEII